MADRGFDERGLGPAIPATIQHCVGRQAGVGENGPNECSLSIRVFSKGGEKDALTATVTVDSRLPSHH